MFRRRRIVVGIAALIAIVFVVFCIYSVSQGIVAVNREIHHETSMRSPKKRCRRLPRTRRKAECRIAAHPTCRCRLTPAFAEFSVSAAPLIFTTTVKYDGSSKVGCLVDASTLRRGADDQSGDDVIWNPMYARLIRSCG